MGQKRGMPGPGNKVNFVQTVGSMLSMMELHKKITIDVIPGTPFSLSDTIRTALAFAAAHREAFAEWCFRAMAAANVDQLRLLDKETGTLLVEDAYDASDSKSVPAVAEASEG